MDANLLLDLGIIGALLMIGFLIRYASGLIQRLFIPVSVIAGLIALFLGNNGLQWISLSEHAGSYPGIFICFIFAAIPFTFSNTQRVASKGQQRSVYRMTLYIAAMLFFQWGLGMLFSLTFLQVIFPDLHKGFGGLIAAGFYGGHGTAAAIGTTFTSVLDWEAVESLAMTSATVGIFISTLGGILLIQWGVIKKETAYLDTIDQLPPEYKTGLIPLNRQISIGKQTISSIAIDPLLIHFLLVFMIGFAALFLSKQSAILLNDFSIAAFSIAFFIGLIIKWILNQTGGIIYFDRALMVRVCGFFTDLLVAFGIASIKIAVIVEYALPLVLLFLVGILLCYFFFRYLGPKTFDDEWFENSIFTWGWVTGITAMGITLLRMVDPESKSPVLQNFAIAYLFVSPFEVLFLVIFPIFIGNQWQWSFTIGCILVGLLLIFLLNRNKKIVRVDD